jgi:hypothetical protein
MGLRACDVTDFDPAAELSCFFLQGLRSARFEIDQSAREVAVPHLLACTVPIADLRSRSNMAMHVELGGRLALVQWHA